MKNFSDKKTGTLLTLIAVIVLSPDALLISSVGVDTWTLVFWRGLLTAATRVQDWATGVRSRAVFRCQYYLLCDISPDDYRSQHPGDRGGHAFGRRYINKGFSRREGPMANLGGGGVRVHRDSSGVRRQPGRGQSDRGLSCTGHRDPHGGKFRDHKEVQAGQHDPGRCPERGAYDFINGLSG